MFKLQQNFCIALNFYKGVLYSLNSSRQVLIQNQKKIDNYWKLFEKFLEISE